MITGDIDCGSLGFAHKVGSCLRECAVDSIGRGLEMHSFFVQWANAYRSLARTATYEPPRRSK